MATTTTGSMAVGSPSIGVWLGTTGWTGLAAAVFGSAAMVEGSTIVAVGSETRWATSTGMIGSPQVEVATTTYEDSTTILEVSTSVIGGGRIVPTASSIWVSSATFLVGNTRCSDPETLVYNITMSSIKSNFPT